MNETRAPHPDGPEADRAREQEVERKLATLEGRFLALAGDRRDEVHRLVNDYYDLTRELGDLERRRHFRELAEFALHYGARDFWKAAFIRLGCDIMPGGWTLTDWYREGDESACDGWTAWLLAAHQELERSGCSAALHLEKELENLHERRNKLKQIAKEHKAKQRLHP